MQDLRIGLYKQLPLWQYASLSAAFFEFPEPGSKGTVFAKLSSGASNFSLRDIADVTLATQGTGTVRDGAAYTFDSIITAVHPFH